MSDVNTVTNQSYILKARTKEGFIIKVLGEYLSNRHKYPCFHCSDKGIFLKATDPSSEVLDDLNLPKENFTTFKCPAPKSFMVNSSHFYKLLKSVKKKDSITLLIEESRPMELGVCVEQADETNKVTTYIKITYVHTDDFDLPTDYDQPIIISSKEFQKLKTLYPIGPDMQISIYDNSVIKFYCDNNHLFNREVVIGDDTDYQDKKTSQKPVYCHNFTTKHITLLTKCAGQSVPGNIQIFYHDKLPLHIKMRAGNLGVLSVYIKSKEIIEDEKDENGAGDEESGDGD